MSQILDSTPFDIIDINVDDLVTEDDTPVDSIYSAKQQRLLTETLYSSWGGPPPDPERPGERRKFLAEANVGLFPTVHQPPLVPDVFLSLDVQVAKDWFAKKNRSYFYWEFGKAPELVIEIVSNRKGNESGSKLRDYAHIGVFYYIVYDPLQQLSDEPFRSYENRVGKFVPYLERTFTGIGLGLTLWEGVYEDHEAVWLRWCDDQGVLIPTGAERAARETERATLQAERAEREAERAMREAERAEHFASRLRDLGVDPDQG